MQVTNSSDSENQRPAWMSGFQLVLSRGQGYLRDIFIFSVLVNILMLTSSMFMLQVYDRVLSSRSVPTLLALTVLVIALYAIMAVIDFARGRIMSILGRRRVSFYEPYVFSAQVNPRVWNSMPQNSRGLRELDTFGAVFNSPALLGFFDIFWMPIFFFAIYLFHPVLGLFALVSGVALVVIAVFNQRMAKERGAVANKHSQAAFDYGNEAVAGREIIASQAMGSVFQQNWQVKRAKAAGEQNSAGKSSGFFSTMTKSLRQLIQSLMLGLGAYFAIQGEVSAGAIIAGSILLGRALAPIEMILGQWSAIQSASNAMDFLERMVAATPQPTKPVEYANLTSDLELRGVSVVDENRKFILAQVSAKLPAGQALGVIGLSGSGKSTLVRAILGLAPVASGEVRLGGVKIDQIGHESLGARVGYLPQEVQLFSGTIAQNIARMQSDFKDEDVINAAKAANVHDLILTLGDGYNTVIEPNKITLSGGQKQRIALARALYGNPLLLVLDEPNSALDDAGSRALNIAIGAIKARGGTVVITTHRPAAIAEADILMMLEGGRVKAFGPRDEVLKSVLQNPNTVAKTIDKMAELKPKGGN